MLEAVFTCLGAGEEALLTHVLRASSLASALGLRFVVVTFSPLGSAAHARLIDSGALALASPPQPSPAAELRAAVRAVARLVPAEASSYIAWMEPSQEDFLRFAGHLCAWLDEGRADLVAPRRAAGGGAAYPAEQAHAEAFGNLYLNALLESHAAAIAAYSRLPLAPPCVDWFFGPVLLRASFACHWHASPHAMAEHEPRCVASLLALLRAVRAGATLATPEITYVQPSKHHPLGAHGLAVHAAAEGEGEARASALDGVQQQWLRLSATIRFVSEEIVDMARATVAQVSAAAASEEAPAALGAR
ncbi:hypothetical protein AB1Y20_021924 [Prymnesium parvum]|uniref:Uncharacterized protein n=1 Tax=Prymnesium parvum TaxID=97485 RepID=A0AB34JEP6_PRYPA